MDMKTFFDCIKGATSAELREANRILISQIKARDEFEGHEKRLQLAPGLAIVVKGNSAKRGHWHGVIKELNRTRAVVWNGSDGRLAILYLTLPNQAILIHTIPTRCIGERA